MFFSEFKVFKEFFSLTCNIILVWKLEYIMLAHTGDIMSPTNSNIINAHIKGNYDVVIENMELENRKDFYLEIICGKTRT